jgi:hypothetical protein
MGGCGVLPTWGEFRRRGLGGCDIASAGGILAIGAPVSPMDSLPPVEEVSGIFLHEIVSEPAFPPEGRFCADGAFPVHGSPEPGAVLDSWYAKVRPCGLRMALSSLLDKSGEAPGYDGRRNLSRGWPGSRPAGWVAVRGTRGAGRLGRWCVFTLVRHAVGSGRIA